MDKVGDKYEFKMKLPDSTTFFMSSVFDEKMKLVDNNRNNTYTVFLKTNRQKINRRLNFQD
jgi:hypothetical protein